MMVSVQEKAHQHITLDASHCKATTSFNWKNKRKVRNMHVLCSISRNSFHYKRYYLFIHTTPFCTIYYTTKQESTCSSPFPLGFGFLWEALKPPTPSIPHKSKHSGVLCGVGGLADVQVSFGGITPRNNLSFLHLTICVTDKMVPKYVAGAPSFHAYIPLQWLAFNAPCY